MLSVFGLFPFDKKFYTMFEFPPNLQYYSAISYSHDDDIGKKTINISSRQLFLIVLSPSKFRFELAKVRKFRKIVLIFEKTNKLHICESKGADQLRSHCEADQRLCFLYTDSTIPLLSKSKISSL